MSPKLILVGRSIAATVVIFWVVFQFSESDNLDPESWAKCDWCSGLRADRDEGHFSDPQPISKPEIVLTGISSLAAHTEAIRDFEIPNIAKLQNSPAQDPRVSLIRVSHKANNLELSS
jgi:hypothetical protein